MYKKTEFIRHIASDGNEICFPVATIEGAGEGPHLVITAGIHGCEYPAIAAAIAMFKELRPEDVSGKITIVTISSLASFEQKCMFVSPYDRKNPNRFFPGAEKGTYTDELVYHLFHELIEGADYHLDMHGGDMIEALVPFTLYHTGKDPETDRIGREMAYAYGLSVTLSTQSDGSWSDRGTNYGNSAEFGIPSVIAEAGGVGQMHKEDVDLHKEGVYNLLRYLKMIPGEVKPPKEEIVEYESFIWLYSPVKGIYYPNCKVGDFITEGQSVGRMEDYFGNELMELKAPCNGRILFLETSPAVSENGLIMGIGKK